MPETNPNQGSNLSKDNFQFSGVHRENLESCFGPAFLIQCAAPEVLAHHSEILTLVRFYVGKLILKT